MKNIVYLIVVMLLVSCAEDLGNYNYKDVNTVGLGLDAAYGYQVPENDTIFEITPELTQSLSANKENLEFVWLHNTKSANFYGAKTGFDTVCKTEKLMLPIKGGTTDYIHYIRLNVIDKFTGIEYSVPTVIKFVKPYHGSWMVLHRENNTTKLGSVEYMGVNMVVTDDAYFKVRGKTLKGNPVGLLGIENSEYRFYFINYKLTSFNTLLGIFTDDPNEAGTYCQWDKFAKMDSLQRSIPSKYFADFDFTNYEYSWRRGRDYGIGLVSNGIFYNTVDGSNHYKAHVDGALGATNITKFGKVGHITLLYDKTGNRILQYYNGAARASTNPIKPSETAENSTSYKINSIPKRDGNLTTADPSKLKADQEVIYIGTGYKYNISNNHSYANALSIKGSDSCFVYEFRSYNISNSPTTDNAPFTGYYTLKRPQDLTKESFFASTEAYSGYIFYALGNNVYCFDYKQQEGNSRLIYSHSEGSKVAKMHFARTATDHNTNYTEYSFPLSKSLGLAFEMADGTGELVILNLNDTGKIADNSDIWPAVQVHKGFGKIKDFTFL